MRSVVFSLVAAACLTGMPAISFAQTPPSVEISDDEIERRAKTIGRQLRCVACQNQSIEESPSTAAEDMRFIILERLKEGRTDEEIIQELHESYGDFILLKPPFKPSTFLLWGLPFFLLLGAGLWFWRAVRKYSDESVNLDT